MAICSVSARDSRRGGTDGQAAIYCLPLFERAVRCTKYFEGWHSEKHYPYVGYGISCYRAKGIRHVPWRSGRQTFSCGKTCGSSVRCSGSLERIRFCLPRLPTMSVRIGFWEAGRYPQAHWFGSWRWVTETSTMSISLSVTIKGTACHAAQAEKGGVRISVYQIIKRKRISL